MIRRLFAIVLLCGFHPLAQAHDPGISRGVVHWNNTGMMIELRFNRPDIAPLLAQAIDRNTAFAKNATAVKKEGLHSLMANGFEVRKAGEAIALTSMNVQPGHDETIRVALTYELAQGSAVEIRIPLLKQLARGHRMHFTVTNPPQGQPMWYLLDRTHPPVQLSVACCRHLPTTGNT